MAAYRGLGAENKAASLVNQVQPGIHTLAPRDGLHEPAWAKERGWYLTETIQGWDTGITEGTSGWSFVVRWANLDSYWQSACAFGVSVDHAHTMAVILSPAYSNPDGWFQFQNKGFNQFRTYRRTYGVAGFAAERCFLNGEYIGDVASWELFDLVYSIYLMRWNKEGHHPEEGFNPFRGDLYSFSCYSTKLTDNQMAAVMAGHNSLRGA